MSKILIVAIDYDGTYTDLPSVLGAMVEDLHNRGHLPILVTMRRDDEDGRVGENIYRMFRNRVYYTGHTAKRPFMERLGIKVDIWIDDNPKWVEHDTTDKMGDKVGRCISLINEIKGGDLLDHEENEYLLYRILETFNVDCPRIGNPLISQYLSAQLTK